MRTAADVRATRPATLARYVNPPANTPYALEYAFHLAGDIFGKHVLDLGCGSGQHSTILAARGAFVSAMDLSPDLLELAARRAELDGLSKMITPVCGSAHSIPLPDSSVDLVFGNAILHHLDLSLTAREVHRVLKPGGRAVFKEPVRDSQTLTVLRGLIPYRQPDVSPYERPLRLMEIEAFAAGFSTWRRRHFELPIVSLTRLARPTKRVQDRVQAWDSRMLQRFPALVRLSTVVVFEVQK